MMSIQDISSKRFVFKFHNHKQKQWAQSHLFLLEFSFNLQTINQNDSTLLACDGC